MTKHYVIQKFEHTPDPVVRHCSTEQIRDSETEMCLIDPSNQIILYLDVNNDGALHCWQPSWGYLADLVDAMNRRDPDDTPLVFQKTSGWISTRFADKVVKLSEKQA